MSVADPEEGPGGVRPPLFLDQTEARRAEKNLLDTAPPFSLGLDDQPPLPYLRVWIRYCMFTLIPNSFSCRLEQRCEQLRYRTATSVTETYSICDWQRDAASLRYKKRSEITVLICEHCSPISGIMGFSSRSVQ